MRIGVWFSWLVVVSILMPAGMAQASIRVLVVGDSHLGGVFGRTLDARLRAEADFAVASYSSCGTTPSHWLTGKPTRCGYREKNWDGQVTEVSAARAKAESFPTPLLERLIADGKPDTVVLAHGTNQLLDGATPGAKLSIERVITLAKAAGATCLWIGPPDERFVSQAQIDLFYVLLREVTAVQGCALIDSRRFATYPATGGDGIHYEAWPALAREWGDRVAAELIKLIRAAMP